MLSLDHGLPHSLIGVQPQASSSFVAASVKYYQRNYRPTSEVTYGKPQFFSQICWLDYPLIDSPMTPLHPSSFIQTASNLKGRLFL